MSVNIVTRIFGVIPADEQYQKMLHVFDACKAADVECPQAVIDFFHLNDYVDFTPSHNGMEIELKDIPELIAKDGNIDKYGTEHYDIDISKLPENIKKIRVYVYKS